MSDRAAAEPGATAGAEASTAGAREERGWPRAAKWVAFDAVLCALLVGGGAVVGGGLVISAGVWQSGPSPVFAGQVDGVRVSAGWFIAAGVVAVVVAGLLARWYWGHWPATLGRRMFLGEVPAVAAHLAEQAPAAAPAAPLPAAAAHPVHLDKETT